MPPRRKRLAAVVKVQLPAGQAPPAPPVGTALGPHGVNIMDFCMIYTKVNHVKIQTTIKKFTHDLLQRK